MAWVVGLISPTLLAFSSMNQMLPSGPAAIPKGLDFLVGMVNSVIVSVVGLIIADLAGASR